MLVSNCRFLTNYSIVNGSYIADECDECGDASGLLDRLIDSSLEGVLSLTAAQTVHSGENRLLEQILPIE